MRVLLVEDDALFAASLAEYAAAWRAPGGDRGLRVHVAATVAAAQAWLECHTAEAILLDLALPRVEDGLAAIAPLARAAGHAPVIVHSVRHDHGAIVHAMRAGAHDYLPKHLGLEATCAALWQLLEDLQAPPAADASPPSEAVAPASPAMAALAAELAAARASRGNVLVCGESGAGKERVARAFAEPGRPFVAVDASTLEPSVAGNLLFGAVRGAFTGVDATRPGLVEQAHGGTLFLDEVANLDPAVQAKLLRVLQERSAVRLGCTTARPARFRLVAATHVDLAAACERGTFRYDLYARLAVFVLAVPPLRRRPDELLPLFAQFVRDATNGAGPAPAIDRAVAGALRARPWHGNVRELEHAAHVAAARAAAGPVLPAHLPPPLPPPPGLDWRESAANRDVERPLADTMRALERRELQGAYQAAGGNVSLLARRLGVDRSRLHVKLRHYGIHAVRRS